MRGFPLWRVGCRWNSPKHRRGGSDHPLRVETVVVMSSSVDPKDLARTITEMRDAHCAQHDRSCNPLSLRHLASVALFTIRIPNPKSFDVGYYQLVRKLPRPVTLPVLVGHRIVSSLQKSARLLGANDNRHRPLCHRSPRREFHKAAPSRLSGADFDVNRPDLRIVGLGPIVHALVPFNGLRPVEHSVKSPIMRVIVDCRAGMRRFDQTVDNEPVIRILIEQ